MSGERRIKEKNSEFTDGSQLNIVNAQLSQHYLKFEHFKADITLICKEKTNHHCKFLKMHGNNLKSLAQKFFQLQYISILAIYSLKSYS